MDFKIGDDIEEFGQTKKSMPNNIKLIIVIVISLIAGVSVFFISNHFFGKKTEPPITAETLSLTDSNVQLAYSYVTYGTLGERYKKLVSEDSVDVYSLTNAEKFMYAFMFSKKDDFIPTGTKDENGLNVYYIYNDKVRNYMQKFFGENVIYSTNDVIELVLDYQVENSNMVTLKYNAQRDSFLATFKGVKEKTTTLISPYIGALSRAIKKENGDLELQEKIIYTDLKENSEDNYTLNIYKDPSKSFLLESKPNLTASSLKELNINISDYYDSASTITYLFNEGSSGYYFVSSSIES